MSLVSLLVLLPIVGGTVAVVVLVSVALARRNKRVPQPGDFPSAPAPARADSRVERAAILQRLADKEITREDAEAQLGTLGRPVPPVMPSAPRATSSGGRGCLIAVLIAIGLLLLLVIGALPWFAQVREMPRGQHELRAHEMMREMQQQGNLPGVRISIQDRTDRAAVPIEEER